MIQQKYLQQVKKEIDKIGWDGDRKFFIFGSSLNREKFGDIDLGVEGDISEKEIKKLKENFKESNLPFKVDVVKIDKTQKSFKDNVLNNKILWIKP